ncbi:MAG: hypothetical protein AAGE18_06945 [Pseudomonadota bacterium]
MNDQSKTYLQFEPGGLVKAEDFNQLQALICADIGAQITAALEALVSVPNADDSALLGGESAEDLLQRFLRKAMEQFPGQTGYQRRFKRLEHDEFNTIEHGLETCPLVDLYQLLRFRVVCAHDDDRHVEDVLFYLYHSSEKKVRGPGPEPQTITIEETGEPAFKIPLFDLLSVLEVEYSDETSLQDLEEELWEKMFGDPNDAFDPEDYCHSPWYERCCREERTVGSLKERGDADQLFIKMMPVKSVNPLAVIPNPGSDDLFQPRNPLTDPPRPVDVDVGHLDFNTVGLRYRDLLASLRVDEQGNPLESPPLHLMVLLKV